MNRRRRQSGGFTLIEALAAGVILALGASGLGLASRQTMQSLRLARDYQQAAEQLDMTFTNVDMIGPESFESRGTMEGICEPPNERFSWKVTINEMQQDMLYEITARISWGDARGESRHVEAQTVLYDSRGSLDDYSQGDEL